jgi:hypothetical protein
MKTTFVFHEQNVGSPAAQYAIPELPLVTIGSDASNRIVLNGDGVSAFHAVLMLEGHGGFVICDQGSGTGIMVNGERVEEHALSDGDMVCIGGCLLRYEDTAAAKVMPPPDAQKVEKLPDSGRPETMEKQTEQERKTLRWVLAVLLLLVLAGSGVLFWWQAGRAKKNEITQAVSAAIQPPNLKPEAAPDSKPSALASVPVKAEENKMRKPAAVIDEPVKEVAKPVPASQPPMVETKTPPSAPLPTPAPTKPRPLSERVWALVSRSPASGPSRYEFARETLTWSAAKERAKVRGGHLATVTSQDEHEQVLKVIPKDAVTAWLGAECVGGRWRWITGEPWGFTAWAKSNNGGRGEPSHPGRENFLEFARNGYTEPGGWNDSFESTFWKNETNRCGYVIEWDAPPLKPLPTSDGRIARLDATFDDAVEKEAMAVWRQKMDRLRGLYQQALERDLAALESQPGKEVEKTEYSRDINLVKNGGEITSAVGAAPALLRQRRQTFLRESARHEMEREKQICTLHDYYGKGLARYASDLVREGDQEAARSVTELQMAIERGRIPSDASVSPVTSPDSTHEEITSRLRGTRWTLENASGQPQGTIEFHADSAQASFGVRGLWTMTGPRQIRWQDHEFVFDENFQTFKGWWATPDEKRSGRRVSTAPLKQ